MTPKTTALDEVEKKPVAPLVASTQQSVAAQAPVHATVSAAATAGAVQAPVKSAQVSSGGEQKTTTSHANDQLRHSKHAK